MKCPVDSSTLRMTSREGIEIDYCPECRGVWLDRGELDKMIDRTASSSVAAVRSDLDRTPGQHTSPTEHHDRDYYGGHTYKKKKREGFLGDLFDF